MTSARFLLALPLAFAAGLWGAHEMKPLKPAQAEAPATPTAPPAPMGVGALGRIEPRGRVLHLSHDQGPEGALVAWIKAEEGQTVKAGDVLVVFSDRDRREAELAAAQARVTEVQARLPALRAERENAASDVARYDALLKSAAIAKAVAEEAQSRLKKAEGALQAAEAEIETAKAQIPLAEQRLAQSVVLAPTDGTVLKIRARPGERAPQTGLMDFADLSRLDVVAEVYENDAPRLRDGQAATVTLPGSDKTYKATVRERGFIVAKNALNDTDPLAGRDARVVEVRLTLDEAGLQDLQRQILRQVRVQIAP